MPNPVPNNFTASLLLETGRFIFLLGVEIKISAKHSFAGMWISWPPSSFSPYIGKWLFYPGNIFRGDIAFYHISL